MCSAARQCWAQGHGQVSHLRTQHTHHTRAHAVGQGQQGQRAGRVLQHVVTGNSITTDQPAAKCLSGHMLQAMPLHHHLLLHKPHVTWESNSCLSKHKKQALQSSNILNPC